MAIAGFDHAFNEKLVIELTHAAVADAYQNRATVVYQRANAAPDSFQK